MEHRLDFQHVDDVNRGRVRTLGRLAVRQADFERYESMLGEVEQAARAARAKGLSANEAGNAYALPASLGEWTLFNKVFFERAFAAWYKELG